jgi:hypothetical protein
MEPTAGLEAAEQGKITLLLGITGRPECNPSLYLLRYPYSEV